MLGVNVTLSNYYPVGRPTPVIQDFLKRISEPGIRGIQVGAFDTILSTKGVRIFAYAAGRIAESLKR